MTESKRNSVSNWVDPDNAPEWKDEQFARAEIRIGDKVIRRGRPAGSDKQAVGL